jgi:hypothetical protein
MAMRRFEEARRLAANFAKLSELLDERPPADDDLSLPSEFDCK